VPVIPTYIHRGTGLEELAHALFRPRLLKPRLTRYDRHVEAFIRQLMGMQLGLTRHEAIRLLSNAPGASKYPEGIRKAAEMMRKEVEQSHSVPIGDLLAGNRYAEAGLIARGVVRQRQAFARGHAHGRASTTCS